MTVSARMSNRIESGDGPRPVHWTPPLGEGDVNFALEPIASGARWAVVVGVNMSPTEDSGDVACDARLLLGDDVRAATTASGTVGNGADGGYLPRRIRFDVITS